MSWVRPSPDLMGTSSSSYCQGCCLHDKYGVDSKSNIRVHISKTDDSQSHAVKRGVAPVGTSKGESAAGDKNSHSPKSGSRVPSWQQQPAPLEGWTAQEQQVLIDELEANPQALRHHAHRERVFEKIHRLTGKTLKQIEQCYHHIQAKRIAYFGKSDSKEGTQASPPGGPTRRSSDSYSNIGVVQRSSKDIRSSLS